MQKMHDEIFEFLQKRRKHNPQLKFTLRRSNRSDRLSNGYWFYGNDEYLAVSFWTGMDWKNKAPNIIFVILSNGYTHLEINTSDSDLKSEFVNKFLLPALSLKGERRTRKRKDYDKFGENYIKSLQSFLRNDKVRIDEIIRKHKAFFSKSTDEKIGLIEGDEFKRTLGKTESYRRNLSGKDEREITSQEYSRINAIYIKNYFPIKELEINKIPFETHWIFFTGENGTGKTSILKALAIAICNRKQTLMESGRFKEGEIILSFFDPRQEVHRYSYVSRTAVSTPASVPILNGFAAYGASRLRTNHSGLSHIQLSRAVSKSKILSSLFQDDPVLLDFQRKVVEWKDDKINKQRIFYFKEIITSILPTIFDVRFEKFNEFDITYYVERDEKGIELPAVTYNELASGLKNIVGMIGDLLVRLYEQQPDTHDPSEFKGIILIDEIDIHLHPNFQMKFVEQLTATFPLLQFIATTHSPIPLLGAPKNSKIFLVERSNQNGVTVKQFDDIDFKNLLPNTLLTSPIFGIDKLRATSNEKVQDINVDDSWEDTKFFKLVDKKLKEFEKKNNEKLNKYFTSNDTGK